MRIPRIYTPQDLQEKSSIVLTDSPAHYIATVLRMKPDRELLLFNGQGGEYQANIVSINKKKVYVDIIAYKDINSESPVSIDLGICLIKSDPMDWLIQKATELGVATISPLFSDFTDIKLPEIRYSKKISHWQQVVVNACQQCGRTVLPIFNQPQKLCSWTERVNADEKWVLHPYESGILSSGPGVASAALLIGPEGGLSEQELISVRGLGFTAAQLGPRILRAETAAIAALTLVQNRFGDLNG